MNVKLREEVWVIVHFIEENEDRGQRSQAAIKLRQHTLRTKMYMQSMCYV